MERHLPARSSGPASSAATLYLAWDFTVASAHALSGRMRGDPRRRLPRRSATEPRRPEGERRARRSSAQQGHDFTPCGTDGCQTARTTIQRRVEGTVEVPCYLDQPGCPPGSRFKLGPDGQPVRTPGNVYDANFICNIPRSVTLGHAGAACRSTATGCSAAPPRSTASAGSPIASEHRVVLCATDWIGMSGGDVAEHDHDPPGPVALPDARRPPPAGVPRLPVPRAAR